MALALEVLGAPRSWPSNRYLCRTRGRYDRLVADVAGDVFAPS